MFRHILSFPLSVKSESKQMLRPKATTDPVLETSCRRSSSQVRNVRAKSALNPGSRSETGIHAKNQRRTSDLCDYAVTLALTRSLPKLRDEHRTSSLTEGAANRADARNEVVFVAAASPTTEDSRPHAIDLGLGCHWLEDHADRSLGF